MRSLLASFLSLFLLSTPALAAERVLLCLGDSLTAGLGLDENQAWPARLQHRVDRELPGWRVVNAGISGETSAGGLKRMDWLLRGKPAAAFVCLGANDGLRGIEAAVIRKNLEQIVARFQAAGTQVYLGGMDLPLNLGERYRGQVKAVYPAVAKARKIPLLPFLLEGVGGVPALNQADGIHPTAEGHVKVAATVGDFLIPQLKGLQAPATENGSKVLRRRSDLKKGKP